jgi:predicted Zn-dependent protease
LPVANPDRRALDDLARDLSGMGFVVELAGRRALPQGAFVAKRRQFHADALLGLALSVRAKRVLAVTDVDLYAGDLNFVFGVAQPSGEACVISLFRLYLDADKEHFRGRALKEAMHELGHTFGLGHCADPACVMWFSEQSTAMSNSKCGRACSTSGLCSRASCQKGVQQSRASAPSCELSYDGVVT